MRLDPAGGGTVLSLTYGNQPLLREAIPGSDDPRDRAAFPLLPFSGRIDQGCFRIADQIIELEKNMPPEPHAIHGQGWQSVWQVAQQSAERAELQLHYAGQDWPWAYAATQTFELDDNRVRISLTLTNQADRPMPAGLGWHPYFPHPENARITAPVEAYWANSADTISLAPSQPSWLAELAMGIPVAALNLDNAFSVGSGEVRIEWPATGIELSMQSSQNLGHLIIYTPPGEPYFCAEPVSHSPNCLNSALAPEQTGKRFLDPGATFTASIELGVRRLRS